mgnify:CR=1 FL=1
MKTFLLITLLMLVGCEEVSKKSVKEFQSIMANTEIICDSQKLTRTLIGGLSKARKEYYCDNEKTYQVYADQYEDLP